MPDLLIRDHRGVVTTYRRNITSEHDERGPVFFRTLSLAEALERMPDAEWTRDDFYEVLTDPDEADDIERCERCDTWEHSDNTTSINGDNTVWCDSCVSGYAAPCAHCGEMGERSKMRAVGQGYACESCYDSYAAWCEECRVNYWSEDGGHDHCDSSTACCSSPMMNFSIPVVSDLSDTGRLFNDDLVEVTLDDGQISSVGLNVIAEMLKIGVWAVPEGEQSAARVRNMRIMDAIYGLVDFGGIGNQYKTADGKYAKRLRSALHKQGITLTPKEVEAVGNIARDNSKGGTLSVAITRDLNMGPEEYAHEESCWWESYAYSRCTLKSNAGFGLRSFIEHSGWTEVSGRAWVIPVAESDDLPGRLRPTFGEPQAYILFNSYGDLDERIGVRTLSAMTGMPWQQARSGDWSMYVNGDSVFLVAPQDLLDRVRDGNLTLPYSLSQHAGLYDRERDSLPRQVGNYTVTIH